MVSQDISQSTSQSSGVANELKMLRRKAGDLNRDGEWGEEALQVNTSIVRLDPSDVASRTRRARCLRAAGDLEAAEAGYREALALDPDNRNIPGAIEEAREEARKKRADEEAAERERVRDQAELENLCSCDEAVAFARKIRESAAPDLAYTVRVYRRALELDASRVDVAVELAGVIRRSGSSKKALVIYDRVLGKAPDYEPALVGKAAVLLDDSRLGEALDLCRRVLERSPENSYARRVKARAHAILGQREESLWNWEQGSVE